MEAEGRNQSWRTHLPESRPRRRVPSPTRRPESESRYPGRRYITRTPLFSARQPASILKEPHPQEDHQPSGSDLTPETFSLSHSDLSPTSPSTTDLGSPLGVSELRATLRHQEPRCRSPYSGCSSESLSRSILEVQRLNPPLRPQLSSTVLHPTYTPRSGSCRPSQTQRRLRSTETQTKLCASGGLPLSPHQANYWACAIPKALPPSPDRYSASWDPDREYQTLLDYTYPLRPVQVVCEGDSSKLQGDSLLQTDPNLQDSGIELDHFCSSTSLLGLDSFLRAGQRSPELLGITKFSDGPPSGPEAGGWSLHSVDSSKNGGGLHPRDPAQSWSSSRAFIRSTCLLPRSRRDCGDLDEEFWPLPDQLEELQLMSRQVREVTAQLSRPITASRESLELDITSTHNTSTHNTSTHNTSTRLPEYITSTHNTSTHNTSTHNTSTRLPEDITSTHNTSTHNTSTSLPEDITSTHNTSTHNTSTRLPEYITSTHNTSTHNTSTRLPEDITSTHNTSTHNTSTRLPEDITSTHNTSTRLPEYITSTHNTSTHNTSTRLPEDITSTHITSTHNTSTRLPEDITSTHNTSTRLPEDITSTHNTSTLSSTRLPEDITSTHNTSTRLPEDITSTHNPSTRLPEYITSTRLPEDITSTHNTSTLSSTRLPEDQDAAAGLQDCGTARRTSGSWVDPVGGGLSPSVLREVEALVERLCGANRPGSLEDQDQEHSLMQHIQVFCSHLEQLVQQVYSVSQKMSLLAPPPAGRDAARSPRPW